MDLPLFLNFQQDISVGYLYFPFSLLLLSSFLLFLLFLVSYSFFYLLLISYSKTESIKLFKATIENINEDYPLLLNLYFTFILLPYLIVIFPPLFLPAYKIINYKINKRIYTYAGILVTSLSSAPDINATKNVLTLSSYKSNEGRKLVSNDLKEYMKTLHKSNKFEIPTHLPIHDNKALKVIKEYKEKGNFLLYKESFFSHIQHYIKKENINNPNYLHTTPIYGDKYKNNESLQDAIEGLQTVVIRKKNSDLSYPWFSLFMKKGAPEKGKGMDAVEVCFPLTSNYKEQLNNLIEYNKIFHSSIDLSKQIKQIHETIRLPEIYNIWELTSLCPKMTSTLDSIVDNIRGSKFKNLKISELINENFLRTIQKSNVNVTYNLNVILNSPQHFSKEACIYIENNLLNYVTSNNKSGIPISINVTYLHPDTTNLMIPTETAITEVINSFKDSI